jgi:hypothetical protein
MAKTILAEYDAEHRTLKLDEPLEGMADRERVAVVVSKPHRARPTWLKCEGMLSPEEGRSYTAAVEELFGPQE